MKHLRSIVAVMEGAVGSFEHVVDVGVEIWRKRDLVSVSWIAIATSTV